jgi:NAD(P) transhydrogenase subunit beta
MPNPLIELSYLFAASCFILGIKFLGSPATARRGNQVAMVGMAVAILTTALITNPNNPWIILIPAVVGAVIGAASARAVRMTAMPQMVALFNGMGGGAAALISTWEYHNLWHTANQSQVSLSAFVPIFLGTLIGCVSFSGSGVAFAKLQELMTGKPITFPLQKPLNGALLLVAVVIAFVTWYAGAGMYAYGAFFAIALLLGILIVLPVGGADMPVIISTLNSCTGLAAAMTGFVLNNHVLVVSGALVGASGTILTLLMSRAMNRSLFNVLFAAVGSKKTESSGTAAKGTVRSANALDVATMLAYAEQVIIVPGYGMAVARAQHDCKELADELERRGVRVKFAIHPVAGRMPGHMNVLLAEAHVPYDQLYEMDSINPEFARTDVVLVIGANDVVNPAARSEPGSPIYGMPILNVDQAKTVVVLKRSMNTGFAGVDNPLFYLPNTVMLFGDAKESIVNLVHEVKTL